MKTQVVRIAFLCALAVLAADAFAVKPEELTPEQIQTAVANKTVLGFWDFLDAAPGTEVSTVANHVTSDLPLEIETTLTFFNENKPKTDWTEDTFPKPTFVVRAPHIRDPRADNPNAFIPAQGVRFYVNPDNPKDFKTAFQLNFKKLSSTLQRFGDFTIEFYAAHEVPELTVGGSGIWRTALKANYWNSYYVRSYVVSNPDTIGCRITNGTNQDKTTNCENMYWRHMAIVKNGGAISFYIDHTLVQTQRVPAADLDSTDRDLILGSNDKDGCFAGTVSALRVTAGALDPSEFLTEVDYPEESFLLDFADGVAGNGVTNVVNALDDNFCGVPRATSRLAYEAVYSDDRPGRYLVADGKVVSENPKSVDFGTSYNKDGVSLEIVDLGRLISKLDAFTLEGFFKMNEGVSIGGTAFMLFCGIDEGTDPVRQFYAGLRGVTQVQSQTWCPDNSGQIFSSSVYCNGTVRDGAWHHYAVTYDKTRPEGSELEISIDYAGMLKCAWTNEPNVSAKRQSGYLNAREDGKENFSPVKATGYRLTPRALTAAEMLVAQDSLPKADDSTVLWWRFEGNVGETFGFINSEVGGSLMRGYGCKFGSTGVEPAFIDGLKRDRIRCGEALVTNVTSAVFNGNKTIPDSGRKNSAETSVYTTWPAASEMLAGDFTAEMFVRCDGSKLGITDNKGKQVFFAVDWKNSGAEYALRLMLRKLDGGFYLDYRDGDECVEMADANAVAKGSTDDKWHHVAVTYDASTKKLALLVDYQEGWARTLTTGLTVADSNHLILGGVAGGSVGYYGQIDEFRISKKVLSANEFLKMVNRPGLMLLFR